jgi:predicted nuclease with TOPRIM domain
VAGDMPDLNTDSFVDTIANTVGVLIVLVVVSIAMSGLKSIEIDPQLGVTFKETLEKQKATRHASTEITQLRHQIGVLAAKNRPKLQELEKVRKAYATASDTLMGRKGEAEGVKGSLENLTRRRATISVELAEATKQLADEIAGLDPGDVASIKAAKVEDLRTQVAVRKSAIDKLAAETAQAEEAERKLAADIAALETRKTELQEMLDKLADLGVAEVTVSDPLRPRDAGKRGIWVECYVDADGVQRVLVVNTENYKKDERALRRTGTGETKRQIRAADSALRAFLAAKATDAEGRHFIHFVVRPEAFAVFREARAIAVGAGWEVRWDPIQPGDSIAVGAPPTAN